MTSLVSRATSVEFLSKVVQSLHHRTMKFSEHLWTHLTPEWYSQYINYDQMKEMLLEHVAQAHKFANPGDALARQLYFLQADEEFFKVIPEIVRLCNYSNLHPTSISTAVKRRPRSTHSLRKN